MSALATPAQWVRVFTTCGVAARTAATWAEIFAPAVREDTFSLGLEEVDDFLGQVLHESHLFEQLEEGLYYKTPGRLMAVWPSRFPDLQSELPYLRNPEALAEKVYGGRMGNTEPGMAWAYRGSGLIQVTGADNFRALQELTGIPVFDNPELLRAPTPEALAVVIAWWEGNVPDAVMDDIRKVTRAVNGGQVGLAERKRLTDEAREGLA